MENIRLFRDVWFRKQNILRLFLLAIVGVASSNPAGAQQTPSVCADGIQTIQHPEQFVVESVSQKIQEGGISCLLHPTCCTPLWGTDPACFAIRTIQRRRKVSDAWTEQRKYTTCQDFSVQQAASTLFKDYVRPVNGFNFRVLGLAGVLKVLGTNVASAKSFAEPLPDNLKRDLKNTFRTLVNDDPDWYGPGYLETIERQIDRTVWIKYDHPSAAALWNIAKVGKGDLGAITFDNLIIAGPDFLSLSGCARTSKWAHEIIHVSQYAEDGWEGFLNEYVGDSVGSTYCQLPYEQLPWEIEKKIRRQCRLPDIDCEDD